MQIDEQHVEVRIKARRNILRTELAADLIGVIGERVRGRITSGRWELMATVKRSDGDQLKRRARGMTGVRVTLHDVFSGDTDVTQVLEAVRC